MADVQLENGFTRIADELLEALCRVDLSARKFRVVLAIARLTYGYQQKVRQIGSGLVAKLTGLEVRNVRRIMVDLESMGVITRTPEGQGFVVGIEKDHTKWTRVSGNPGHLSTRVTGDPSTRVGTDPSTRVTGDPTLKRTLTENSTESKNAAKAARALNLLAKHPGSKAEKLAFLEEHIDQIELDARSHFADKEPSKSALQAETKSRIIRYWRQHRKNPQGAGAPRVRPQSAIEAGAELLRDMQ